MIFTKHHPAFDSLFFVLSAISKDSLKPALQCLKVESDRMYASDGWRLHIAENVGLDPGLYESPIHSGIRILLYPIPNVEEETLKYPEIDHAIWDYKAEGLKTFPLAKYEHPSVLDYCHVIRNTSDQYAYNYEWFQASKRGMSCAIYDPEHPAKGLVLINRKENRLALLMPIRTNN